MALRERAALLSGGNRTGWPSNSSEQNQALRPSPIDTDAGFNRLGTSVEKSLNGAVDVESCGTAVIFLPISLSVSISAPVLPRRVVDFARLHQPSGRQPVSVVGLGLARLQLDIEARASQRIFISPGNPPR